MALPQAGTGRPLRPRDGQLVDLARGLRFDPLQPLVPVEPVRAAEVLDEPETDAWRLLFLVKRLLHPLLDRLADDGTAPLALAAPGPEPRVPTAPAPAAARACVRPNPPWTWCC